MSNTLATNTAYACDWNWDDEKVEMAELHYHHSYFAVLPTDDRLFDQLSYEPDEGVVNQATQDKFGLNENEIQFYYEADNDITEEQFINDMRKEGYIIHKVYK